MNCPFIYLLFVCFVCVWIYQCTEYRKSILHYKLFFSWLYIIWSSTVSDQCLSRAFQSFPMNITCALHSRSKCSNALMTLSFFLSTWWITLGKSTEERMFLWDANKSWRQVHCKSTSHGKMDKGESNNLPWL